MQTVRVHTRQEGRSRSRTLLAALVPLLVLLAVQAGALPTVEQVEPALLKGDWPALVELLKDVTPQTPSPVLRLIKGHACLAENMNNEALCLFLSVTGAGQAEDWYEWAKGLPAAHPDNPIAYYVAGDALARLGRSDEAIAMFRAGLAKNPGDAFCQHACGVVYASREDWDGAKPWLVSALSSTPQRAEFCLSYANYLSGRRSDPKKALTAYEEALAISPDYVLALNGAGNMNRVLKRWDEGNETLSRAAKLASGCLESVANLIGTNLLLLGQERGKDVDMILADATGVQPGTDIGEIFRQTDAWSPGAQQRFADGLGNDVAWQKDLNSHLPDQFQAGGKLEIGVNPLGPYVQGGPEVKMSWDIKNSHAAEIGGKEKVLDMMEQKYGVTPNKISNTEGWLINHDPTNRPILNGITNGGVTAKDIKEQTQNRNWSAVTMYGLLYPSGKSTAK